MRFFLVGPGEETVPSPFIPPCTDHLLSRHRIRAQKSIIADNTRAELQGSCSECYVGH